MQRKKEKRALYQLYSLATLKYLNRILGGFITYLFAILPALMMSKKDFEIITHYLSICAGATFGLFIIVILMKTILSENPDHQPMLEKIALLWLFTTKPTEYNYGYSNQIKLILVMIALLMINDICIKFSEKYIDKHIERFIPYAELTQNQYLYEGEYKNYYLKNGIRTFYITKINKMNH